MVRTKKHFRPPSPASSSSSSSEGEDDANEYDHQVMVQRGRGKQMGNFGRGKQFSMAPPPVPAGGRGKQLRAPEPESEEEESSDSDDSSSDDDGDQQAVAPPPTSRGKQLRPPSPQQQPVPVPRGRGKQLRAPSPPPQQEEEEDSDSSESAAPAYHPPSTYQPSPAVVQRGVGKHFGRSMGKQLPSQPPLAQEEDSDSSSSEEEPFAARPRGGKQLIRPPPTLAKDESDMEESSSDEDDDGDDDEEKEEEEVKKEEEPELPKPAPTPVKKPRPNKQPNREPEPEQDPEPEESVKADESEESEFEIDEPAPTPSRRGRPPRAAAAKADKSARATAKKEISSEEEEMLDDEEDIGSSDESSSDEEQEWDMETFDMQKLVKGDEDQRYLDSLTELDRENILAERFEKLKQEADMKKALRENKRKEREKKREARKKKPAKKRSAPKAKKRATPARKKKKVESESESEEGEGAPDTSADVALAQSLAGKRVSTRNLDKKGKQFKKQAALQKIRENRANRAAEVEESGSDYGGDSDDDSDDDYEEEVKPWRQRGKRSSRIDDGVSDEDSREGVEDDGEQEPSQGQRRLEDIGAELEDYIKVSIPRRRLIQWCNEPFFERAVKDFYVRLGIGRDNKTQKACYRLCRITGVVRGSEYSFPQVENQKSVSTDKWLRVSFGKFEKEFRMITVSEHRPSLDDVNKLVSQLRTSRQSESLLTKKSANKLRKRQDDLVYNYTYTKEDIEVLVEERKKRNKKALNIGLEKTRIAIAVQAARDEVEDAKKRLEDAKVERMEADDDFSTRAEEQVTKEKDGLEAAMKKLETKLEEQENIQKEDQDRINRLKQSSKVQNWAKVNQRAKMANRNADFQSYKEQQARKKSQGSTEPKFDPYARRRVKPKNLWEVGDKVSGGGGEEEKKETSPTERDDTNVGNINDDKDDNKREDNGIQKLEVPGQASNQLVFDDDIMIGGDVANLGIGTKKKARTRVRRGISLEEYQQRKASGTL